MARAKTTPAEAEGSGRPPPRAADRTLSSGSFHAGAPIPTLASALRRAPTHRYQTFPTKPPKAPVDRRRRRSSASTSSDSTSSSSSSSHDQTPLPVRQLLLLALLSLSEQTALNSISPYLPGMVSSMPGVPPGQGGLYVGILASAFALAQLSTNLLWGWASDLVGRKPVLLAGTASLAACFAAFGLCRRYWHVVVVHVAMGLLNGNAACVPTVLGEVTDRSNQSKAFTYLPVIYSLGGITGPALGGLLVGRIFGPQYPYLAPNLFAATLLALSVVVVGIWFRETLDQSGVGPWKPLWIRRLSSWLRRPGRPKLNRNSWSTRWPQGHADHRRPLLSPPSPSSSADNDDDDDQNDVAAAINVDDDDELDKSGSGGHKPVWRDLLNHTTITLLATYLVFQLSNISFNSLYPIFAAARPPTGRQLGPGNIGVSLSLAGLATIIFQAFLYQPLQAKMGNLGTYRFALLGIAVSMVLMPWVGYLDDDPPLGIGTGRLWLYVELGLVLILKNICAVGGLSSVMLLITNSAPSHASLGTLNGVAQTLSALGRSFGPFVSGGLFTLSINVRPKGEALAWSVFGGLALAGWVGSMFIRGVGLESEDWEGGDEDYDQPDRRSGSV
ncbi:major facilitator superfamily protein [Hirsutella rhossiliensis]|uniref:Major facilitator superfamily domain-containing protein n=1 Tax=Hirsutella rhossiliensis TaxID=111463 RepID=A0A9P8MUZ1_9HYPO|nr:major facilitator superfamily domain-containing protein [Hirsutella rhossiliensis]KAH0961710.1 major facilitator superfamily domain-containing protein [Hirsutella rhossiliensis]